MNWKALSFIIGLIVVGFVVTFLLLKKDPPQNSYNQQGQYPQQTPGVTNVGQPGAAANATDTVQVRVEHWGEDGTVKWFDGKVVRKIVKVDGEVLKVVEETVMDNSNKVYPRIAVKAVSVRTQPK